MRKKKTKRRKLKDQLDKLARDYIKLRDNMTCQMCGAKVKGSNAHCSHVIPKSQGDRLRWDPLNLKLLCFHCHMNVWHKSPLDAWQWFESTFPERWAYIEKEKAKGSKKFTIMELEELRDWYIREIENYE